MKGRTNWVLDADIRSFFDTIDHGWMQKFIEHRIADTRLVRLLMKWLKAGVMQDGEWRAVEVYLHYVLDLWVQQWRKQHARQVYVVRYADDFVMGFEDGRDARSMRSELRKRLQAFGLELHEDKTRVLRFGRYARERCRALGLRVETFDFLGFTHIAGADRKNGWFQLLRHTSRKKRQAKLAAISKELRRRRNAFRFPSPRSVTRGRRNALVPVDPRWEPGAGNPLAGFCPGGPPKGGSLPGPALLTITKKPPPRTKPV